MPESPEAREHRLAYYKAWRASNRAEVQRKDRERNELRRDYNRAKCKQWRDADPKRARASEKASRGKNPEKVRAWRDGYRDKFRMHEQIRRARERGVVTDRFTDKDIIDLYGTDCHICGEAIDLDAPRWTRIPGWERGLHIDHKIPISRGGPHTLANCRPSHGLCNVRKKDRLE